MSMLLELQAQIDREQTTQFLNEKLAPFHWCWIPSTMTLRYQHNGIDYPVPLTDMRTCADMLDWIMQLTEKQWLGHSELGAFIHAVNELIRPQACLCSGGNDRGEIDVRRQLPEGFR